MPFVRRKKEEERYGYEYGGGEEESGSMWKGLKELLKRRLGLC